MTMGWVCLTGRAHSPESMVFGMTEAGHRSGGVGRVRHSVRAADLKQEVTEEMEFGRAVQDPR